MFFTQRTASLAQSREPSQPTRMDAAVTRLLVFAVTSVLAGLGLLLVLDALGAVLVELLVLGADLLLALLGLAAAASPATC